MAFVSERRFRAFRRGGCWYLYCRRCDTHEAYIDPERIEDHAEMHANWWHRQPPAPPNAGRLTLHA